MEETDQNHHEVPSMPHAHERPPLVYRFETKRFKYVYDANTNQIVRVDPVVWDVLHYLGYIPPAIIGQTCAGVYSARQIAKALLDIESARRSEGLFCAPRVQVVKSPYDPEHVAQVLRKNNAHLILEGTRECNLRCRYCLSGNWYECHRPHAAARMSWDIARQAIDANLGAARAGRFRTIGFFGGEPLLNVELIEKVVRYVKDELGRDDVAFTITTNDVLLAGEIARLLAENDFMIQVSLHTPRELHDRDRTFADGRTSWDIVTENLSRLRATYPDYRKLRINTVLVPPVDLRQVHEFWRTWELTPYLSGLGVQELSVNDLTPERTPEGVVAGRREMYELFLRMLRAGVADKNDVKTPDRLLPYALHGRWFSAFYNRKCALNSDGYLPEEAYCPCSICIPGDVRRYVTFDGHYYPCERCDTTTDGLRIGNVTDGLDANKAARILREYVELRRDECLSCWCLSYCSPSCMAAVQRGGSLDGDLKAHNCRAHRESTAKLMADLCEILEDSPRALDFMKWPDEAWQHAYEE